MSKKIVTIILIFSMMLILCAGITACDGSSKAEAVPKPSDARKPDTFNALVAELTTHLRPDEFKGKMSEVEAEFFELIKSNPNLSTANFEANNYVVVKMAERRNGYRLYELQTTIPGTGGKSYLYVQEWSGGQVTAQRVTDTGDEERFESYKRNNNTITVKIRGEKDNRVFVKKDEMWVAK